MAKRKSKHKQRKAGGSGRPRLVFRDMPELQQARSLWTQNRFRQSLELFDRAVRKEPSNAMALADAARAHGGRFEFARAEQLLQRLVEIGSKRADCLQLAGQSYRMIQRPARAIDCLERALALTDDQIETRLELAILYERQHELSAAGEQLSAALAKQPSMQEAKLLAARIARRSGDLVEADRLLAEVTSAKTIHWTTQAQAWHEWGELFDEQSEYDQAFQAVSQAKRVIDAHASDVRERAIVESRMLENLHDELTAQHFARWRKESPQRGQPDCSMALLTGAPRSGTTLLEKVLDSHASIVTSDEQEAFPKFILPSLLVHKSPGSLIHAEELSELPTERIQEERIRYWRYMEGALGESIGDRCHVDKNPSIIMLIPGMLRLFPECKLLIAIRDPRDVVVSCFMRYLPLNTASVQFLSVEDAAKRYVRDMEAWLKLRETIGSPWHEVRYEQTVMDLPTEARRALEFLGADWDDRVLSYREHLSGRRVNSPTYEAVAKPIYRSAMGRWQNYQRHLAPAFDLLDPLVAKLGYA